MALTNPLITVGYVGSPTKQPLTLALIGKAIWTESSALPYTTTKAAPELHDTLGDPAFTIVSPVDAIVSIGKSPNASTGPRYLLQANVERTIYCEPGDKATLVAA